MMLQTPRCQQCGDETLWVRSVMNFVRTVVALLVAVVFVDVAWIEWRCTRCGHRFKATSDS